MQDSLIENSPLPPGTLSGVFSKDVLDIVGGLPNGNVDKSMDDYNAELRSRFPRYYFGPSKVTFPERPLSPNNPSKDQPSFGYENDDSDILYKQGEAEATAQKPNSNIKKSNNGQIRKACFPGSVQLASAEEPLTLPVTPELNNTLNDHSNKEQTTKEDMPSHAESDAGTMEEDSPHTLKMVIGKTKPDSLLQRNLSFNDTSMDMISLASENHLKRIDNDVFPDLILYSSTPSHKLPPASATLPAFDKPSVSPLPVPGNIVMLRDNDNYGNPTLQDDDSFKSKLDENSIPQFELSKDIDEKIESIQESPIRDVVIPQRDNRQDVREHRFALPGSVVGVTADDQDSGFGYSVLYDDKDARQVTYDEGARNKGQIHTNIEHSLSKTSSQSKANSDSSELMLQMRQYSTLQNDFDAKLTNLVLLNSRLEAQLDSVSKEYQFLIKEKTQLQTQVWEAEDKLNDKTIQFDVVQDENNELNEQTNVLKGAVMELENQLKHVKLEDSSDHESVSNLNIKLAAAQKDCEDHLSQIASMKNLLEDQERNLLQKDNDLKAIIEKLEANKESETENGYFVNELKQSLKQLQENKNWLELQINSLIKSRNNLENALEMSVNTETELQKVNNSLEIENKQVLANMEKYKVTVLKEKEDLSLKLLAVEREVLRQSELAEVALKDKQRVEDKLEKSNEECSKQAIKLASVLASLADSESIVTQLKNDIRQKERLINLAESEIENLKTELKNALSIQVSLKKQLEDKEIQIEYKTSELRQAHDASSVDDERVAQLEEEKNALTKTVMQLKREASSFQDSASDLDMNMKKLAAVYTSMKASLSDKTNELEGLQGEKHQLFQQIQEFQLCVTDLEKKYKAVSLELKNTVALHNEMKIKNETLFGEVQDLRKRNNDLQTRVKQLEIEKIQLETSYSESQRVLKVKEQELILLEKETKNYQEAMQENKKLWLEDSKSLTERNKTMQNELYSIKKGKESEQTKLRSKVAKLSTNLETQQKEWLDKQEKYEKSIYNLVESLKNETMEKSQLEKQVEESYRAENVKSHDEFSLKRSNLKDCDKYITQLRLMKQNLKKDVFDLRYDFTVLSSTCIKSIGVFKTELLRLETTKATLEKQLHSMNSKLGTETSNSLQLSASNSNLVSHVKILQEALNAKANELMSVKKRLAKALYQRETCQKTSTAEKNNLQDQILVTKREADQLKESLNDQIGQNRALDSNLLNLQKRNLNLEEEIAIAKKELQHSFKSNTDSGTKINVLEKKVIEWQSNYHRLKQDVELQKLSNDKEKDTIDLQNDHIRHLKWQLTQKSQETERLRTQMQNMKKQQGTELDQIKSKLSVSQIELTDLKKQRSQNRQTMQSIQIQNSSYHNQLEEQKVAYERLVSRIKIHNAEMDYICSQLQNTKSTALREAVSLIRGKAILGCGGIVKPTEKSTVDTSDVVKQLQSCMALLRSEMGDLKENMVMHRKNIQQSDSKLLSLDNDLKELKTICSSPSTHQSNQIGLKNVLHM